VFETSNLRRIAGKHVVGADGERIGRVTDVYESTTDGGGTFATVATGLFGTSSSFFPLDAAEVHGDELVIPYSKELVKNAPRVDNDEELTADEEQRLFEYYDLADPASDTGAPTTQDGADGSEQAGGPATGGPATDGAMTRSEERLHVGTEQVPVGRARLRKYVVSETVTRTVPVSHEELRVTREPIADGPPGAVPPSRRCPRRSTRSC
jgi:stress response protein YsnF